MRLQSQAIFRKSLRNHKQRQIACGLTRECSHSTGLDGLCNRLTWTNHRAHLRRRNRGPIYLRSTLHKAPKIPERATLGPLDTGNTMCCGLRRLCTRPSVDCRQSDGRTTRDRGGTRHSPQMFRIVLQGYGQRPTPKQLVRRNNSNSKSVQRHDSPH